MNPKKTLFALSSILLILFLSVSVLASPQVAYEKAAVGRIVGDSPSEMIASLNRGSVQPVHASFFTQVPANCNRDESYRAEDIEAILGAEFPGAHDTHLDGDCEQPDFDAFWNWDDLDSSIDAWSGQSVLVIEAKGKLDGDDIQTRRDVILSGYLTPGDTASWLPSFSASEPLVIFDADYAGVYLPKTFDRSKSYVGQLAQDSTFIAPTAFPNPDFMKAFICSMPYGSTVGEVYKDARNRYYWQDASPSGLALMSYELYGSPLALLNTPAVPSQSSLEEYCEPYLGGAGFASLSVPFSASGSSVRATTTFSTETYRNAFTGTSLGITGDLTDPASYVESFTFNVGAYTIIDDGNYSILTTENTFTDFTHDELVLPKQVRMYSFPLKTIIKDISLTALRNPVDLPINNSPMWLQEYVDRVCWSETQPAGITYAHSFTETEEVILITLRPVEVLNCTTGDFRLYQDIDYEITYLPNSPLLIDAITAPSEAALGDAVSVDVDLMNIKAEDQTGNLFIRAEGDTVILATQSVTVLGASSSIESLSLTAPSTSGTMLYEVVFEQSGEEKTERSFTIPVRAADIIILSPAQVSDNTDLPVRVQFQNKQSTPDVIDARLELRDSEGSIHYAESVSRDLVTESSDWDVTLQNLGPSTPESYTISVSAEYFGETYDTTRSLVVSDESPSFGLLTNSFADNTYLAEFDVAEGTGVTEIKIPKNAIIESTRVGVSTTPYYVDGSYVDCAPALCATGFTDTSLNCGDSSSDTCTRSCSGYDSCEPTVCGAGLTDAGVSCDPATGVCDRSCFDYPQCAPTSCLPGYTDSGVACTSDESQPGSCDRTCYRYNSCTPSTCPSGYTDLGASCSGSSSQSGTCTRICQKYECDASSETNVHFGWDDDTDSNEPCDSTWSANLLSSQVEYDIPSTGDYCYRIRVDAYDWEAEIDDVDCDIFGNTNFWGTTHLLADGTGSVDNDWVADGCDRYGSYWCNVDEDSFSGTCGYDQGFTASSTFSADNFYCAPTESACDSYGSPCSSNCAGERVEAEVKFRWNTDWSNAPNICDNKVTDVTLEVYRSNYVERRSDRTCSKSYSENTNFCTKAQTFTNTQCSGAPAAETTQCSKPTETVYPTDLAVRVDSTPVWSSSSVSPGTIEMVGGWESIIENALANCEPDEENLCTIPVEALGSGFGDIVLSDLEIYYTLDEAPVVDVLLGSLGATPTFEMGDTIELSINAVDPTGDPITYAWLLDDVELPGETTDSLSYVVPRDVTRIGVHTLTSVVRDTRNERTTDFKFRVTWPDLLVRVAGSNGINLDGLKVDLMSLGNIVLQSQFSANGGLVSFDRVVPGLYMLRTKHYAQTFTQSVSPDLSAPPADLTIPIQPITVTMQKIGGTYIPSWVVANYGSGEITRAFADGVNQVTFNLPPNVYTFSVKDGGEVYTSDSVDTSVTSDFAFTIIAPSYTGAGDGSLVVLPLDEGSGTTAGDTSGLSNDGVIQGATWTSGWFTNGLAFDGVDDYVDLGTNAALSPESISISAWIKPSSDGIGGRTIVTRKDSNNVNYKLELDGANRLVFKAWINGFGLQGPTSAPISMDEWHHVVATYEPVFDGQMDHARIYVDGVQFASQGINDLGYQTIRHFDSMTTTISDSLLPFNGLMDDIRIYNRGLSISEIRDLYTSAISTFSFSEGSGDLLVDLSGENGGTIQGATWVQGVENALLFDGVDDYVDLGTSDSLSPEAITVSAWVNPARGGSGTRTIVERKGVVGSSVETNYKLELDDENRPVFKVWVHGFALQGPAAWAAPALSEGRWHHVVGTYAFKADGQPDYVRVYVDGVQVASQGVSDLGYQTIRVFSGMPAKLSSVDAPFSGMLSRVNLYDRALPAAEIARIYAEVNADDLPIPSAQPGELLHLPLNEGAGLSAYDYAGTNDGAIQGATWVTGYSGSALSFDGVGDYVLVGSDALLSPDIITLAAWVKPSSSGSGVRTIIQRKGLSGSKVETNYALELNSNDQPVFKFWIDGFGLQNFYSTGALTPDVWSHVAASYEFVSDGQPDTARIYVNGAQVASRNFNDLGYQSIRQFPSMPTTVSDPDTSFTGLIDEVRVYDRKLSSTEILDLYNE